MSEDTIYNNGGIAEQFLHPRIVKKCYTLYLEEHYLQASFESMKQVEIAIKEKLDIKSNLFGARLIEVAFGKKRSIKLKNPFGPVMQSKTEQLFKSTFLYYRNYLAHNEISLDSSKSFRIMIIASELLDLINASVISFSEIGGIDGLIQEGLFQNEESLCDFLNFLSNQTFPFQIYDGMFEELCNRGFDLFQYQSVFDLGLVVYKEKFINHSAPSDIEDYDYYGWIELTILGKNITRKNVRD